MSIPQGFEIFGAALTPVDTPGSSKRKAHAPPPTEYLSITPLGAGNEVGRSCIILKYKDKTVMLDCGIHPAHTGIAALPYFDEVDPSTIDVLLVSHFHLDHAAALPYFLEKTDFKGRVFMTHPTRSIYKLILQDYVKVSSIAVEDSLYNENDLKKSMDKIETVDYHQTVHVNGIKFWCYNAGHVLGAAMFMIEIAGVKVLYTGDYSRKDDRHLTGAETPDVNPDVLIVESTYGKQTLSPIQTREKKFTDLVHQILKRGGRCLIPVFALGRAQELLLILDEYWEQNHSLQSYPIWYASALAKKCMSVYQTYINMMNKKIRRQFETANPFMFKHVRNMKGYEDFDDFGPSVVFASPGMLQNGLSRDLFESWCSDKKNGVIIPGYSVEGTLAKQITLEPREIESQHGQKLPLNMSVHYVTFSAHADYSETKEFIDTMKPPDVILVHGDANEMAHLSSALKRIHKKEGNIRISTPKNCQQVDIEFRSEKIAKTVGRLASKLPQPGDVISGLVVRKDFSLNLMDPNDLGVFTPLASAMIEQTMKIPFKQTFECLQTVIGQVYDASDVKVVENTGEEKEVKTINVYDAVTVTVHTQYDYLTLSWHSNPVNDMIADSLICIILTIETNASQGTARTMSSGKSCGHSAHGSSNGFTGSNLSPNGSSSSGGLDKGLGSEKNEDVERFLKKHFGEDVQYDKQHNIFLVSLDDKTATVDNTTLAVTCSDEVLKKRLHYVCGCIRSALFPLRRIEAPIAASFEEELKRVSEEHNLDSGTAPGTIATLSTLGFTGTPAEVNSALSASLSAPLLSSLSTSVSSITPSVPPITPAAPPETVPVVPPLTPTVPTPTTPTVPSLGTPTVPPVTPSESDSLPFILSPILTTDDSTASASIVSAPTVQTPETPGPSSVSMSPKTSTQESGEKSSIDDMKVGKQELAESSVGDSKNIGMGDEPKDNAAHESEEDSDTERMLFASDDDEHGQESAIKGPVKLEEGATRTDNIFGEGFGEDEAVVKKEAQ